jgi:hypothetical protein
MLFDPKHGTNASGKPKRYSYDKKLDRHKHMKYIAECLDRLDNSDVLERLPMNCISACDIIQNMLMFYGIPSKIVECQAIAIKETPTFKDFSFVGFNEIDKHPHTVDSHVVVVTQTEPPIMIDAAVGHLLPADKQIVVAELVSVDPDLIAEVKIDEVKFQYLPKKTIRLPGLHQKNLVDRMKSDMRLSETIDTLKVMVYLSVGLSVVNMMFNISILWLKLHV